MMAEVAGSEYTVDVDLGIDRSRISWEVRTMSPKHLVWK